MEIETEVDAPLPDELEWLENADAQFDEPDPAGYDDDDDELLELLGASPEDDSDSRKRQRGEEAKGSDDAPVAEKRSRRGGEGEEEVADVEKDEDWLRYSPSREGEVEEVRVEEKIVSRFASEIDGDFVAVTSPDGERVFAKMGLGLGVVDARRRLDKPSKGLLLEPIEVLMERLDDRDIQKAMQESFGPQSCSSDTTSTMVSERLWVDKYAPSSFLELLSDEQTNREVLLWLKQWDSFVFGSQIRATTEDVLSALRRHSSSVQHQKSSNSKIFSKDKRNTLNNKKFEQSKNLGNGSESSKGIIESSRKTSSSPPEQKVLLLCGPPGLGKTTLAHVAAKHCGYHVVEINASDERSSSAVESKILDVVQMNSVMASSKPRCLVIDEIDGALGEGKGVVEVILKMITAENKSNSEISPNSSSGKVHNRRRRRTVTLSRPVICICNDLYSLALRPLRQVAKVHTFVQPTISRVVNRLKYICGKEGFRTSSVALAALAECTECDIRSCLNTLQFLNKKKENLNILDIDSQVVGRKDMSRTAYDVWKEVLQQRKQKRGKPRNLSTSSGDFEFLYNLVSNCGEYELTANGIYENFLQLGYHDPAMHKTVACLDVLGISDSLNRFIMRTQQMPLYAYQPFVAIRVKNLVAQVGRPQIEWPKSLQRCRTMLMENNHLFKCWHNTLSPSISRHLSMESFVHDAISPLLHILAPPTLRPVAPHLLSEREKDDISQLVDTMVSYLITYKHSKPETLPKTRRYGAGSDADLLTLDPPIDSFVKFKGHRVQYSGLSSSVKQVLVHEVEKQKILCDGIGRCLDVNDVSQENQVSSHGSIAKRVMNTVDSVSPPNVIKNGMPKNMPTPDSDRMSAALGTKSRAAGSSAKTARHPSSFFDRFRKRSSDENPGCTLLKAATIERDQRPFLFKYNEGFTNAIKRPVRMRELQ